MRLFFLLIFISISLFAQDLLRFKAQWQMMGPTQAIEIKDFFNREEVLQVWAYDGATQKWLGYSPDSNISSKIAAHVSLLQSITAYQAIWILSQKEWSAAPQQTDIIDINNSDKIHLYEGWNLVALPSKRIVSPSIFGDDVTLWKKPFEGPWQFQGQDESEFTPLRRIAASEALWVKSKSEKIIDLPQESAKLTTFDSHEQMVEFIHELTVSRNNNYYGCFGGIEFSDPNTLAEITSADGVSAEKVSDATGTNTQESDVDEADFLKHNGETIFFHDRNSKEIKVSSFNKIVTKDETLLSTIKLSTSGYFNGMYIYEDQLVVLESIYPDYTIQNNFSTQQNRVKVTFYDINNSTNITEIKSYSIDGSMNSSRISGGKLQLITQFYPRIEYTYPLVETTGECPNYYHSNDVIFTTAETPTISVAEPTLRSSPIYYNYCYVVTKDGKKYNYDYSKPSIEDEYLIPILTTDLEKIELIKHDELYASMKLDQSAQMTSVSLFDLNNSAYDESLSYIGNSRTLYASSSALYLSSIDYGRYYNFFAQANEETIYKFSLKNGLSYMGRDSIQGHLLNQFSLSENSDVLRVATTERAWWPERITKNRVYTLGQNEDNNFSIIGELTEGIGHKGESIRAVRFVGERGFIVTFRQTDPFYTLDMSDTSAPRIAGELKINGFSEYFHPIDENRIMSIGRDADENGILGGLQLELFDITDFSHPFLADKITIGDRNTYSSLEHDHKALAYRSSDKLFAFPYRTYNYQDPSSRSLGVYKVEGMQFSPTDTISFDDNSYGVARSILFTYGDITYSALYANGTLKAQIIKDK